jgi:hypothetical protein
MGVSYQQAVEADIEVTLGGLITASAYPEGAEGPDHPPGVTHLTSRAD